METFLTTAEVAAILRTPESSLRAWRHAGKGPIAIKLGKRTVYAESDLVAWIAERRGAAA